MRGESGFMAFVRALMWSETEVASFRICTILNEATSVSVAEFISNNDHRYSTPSTKETIMIDKEENYHIYPTPPLGQDMTQGQFFKWSLTGLNSEFSFS